MHLKWLGTHMTSINAMVKEQGLYIWISSIASSGKAELWERRKVQKDGIGMVLQPTSSLVVMPWYFALELPPLVMVTPRLNHTHPHERRSQLAYGKYPNGQWEIMSQSIYIYFEVHIKQHSKRKIYYELVQVDIIRPQG